MPKSNSTVALEELATLVQGLIVKMDYALELLGDPSDEATGNDPAEVPPLDLPDE